MTPVGLLAIFFLFTLSAVALAGYLFVLRPSRTSEVQMPAPLKLGGSDLPIAQAAIVSLFRRMGDAIPGSPTSRAEMQEKLITAGFRWESGVSIFLGVKAASALMFGAFCMWLAVMLQTGLAFPVLPPLCGLAFGYMLPDRILTSFAARRVRRLRRALPAALDLMVLTLEAGQSLDASIWQASRGLRISHPELASEFSQLYLDLRANPSRADALRNFASRGRDLELRKFANLLIDTDRFGTSLGPALRTHARYLRVRFRQVAQEKARKVGVKLVFPVFFLIFPSVILVTLGPAVILIYGQMSALLGQ